MGRLGVGLLGPFAVTCDGREIALSGTKRRAVLAMLALHPGETVSTSRLIDGIWAEDAPETVKSVIQRAISDWRKAFVAAGCAPTILSRPAGYALDVVADQVDIVRFDTLVATGRRAMAEARHGFAVDSFQQAMSLVRGEPLGEFVDLEFQAPAARRLTDEVEHLAADRIDCLLAIGQGGELVAELQGLVSQYPVQERFRAQLMHALYRSGRQVDASRVYAQARASLAGVGFEPGPALKAMEQAVLRQDPELDSHSSPFSPTPPPLPLTSLIGRERDVERVVMLARETSERLITLTGPGGVGKTRLGIEVATRIIQEAWSPVAYVALSDVADPAVVSSFINAGFGVPESWRERPLREVARLLGEAPLLLVIDGVEHLIETVRELVREILEQGPRLRVLLTSRVPVGLVGERQVPVRPLPSQLGQDSVGFTLAPAVALFIDRCQRLDDSAVFTDSEVDMISQVCERVDGLPLGIELAAARAATFGVAGLLERLGASLDLLRAPRRQTGGRHESLRQVIEWSYDLLGASAQHLLARLSVYAGGFTVTQMEEMWMEEGSASLLASFAELDRSSLLARIPGATPRRFRMLDTVAELARERLDALGETGDAHDRLIGWLRTQLRSSGGRIGVGPLQFGPLEPDADNARAAVAWALDHLEPDDATDLCTSMYVWWMYAARRAEIGTMLLRCLTRECAPSKERARALLYEGRIQSQVSHFAGAQLYLREAIAIYRTFDDDSGVVSGLTTLAEVSAYLGDLESAHTQLAEALALVNCDDDTELQCRVLAAQQWIATLSGDFDMAERVGTTLVSWAARSGWVDLEAKTLGLLAQNDRTTGQLLSSLSRLERAVGLSRDAQNLDALEFALSQQAMTLSALGRHHEAVAAAVECLQCMKDGESDPWAVLRSAAAIGMAMVRSRRTQAYLHALEVLRAVRRAYPDVQFPARDRELVADLLPDIDALGSFPETELSELSVLRMASRLVKMVAGRQAEPVS